MVTSPLHLAEINKARPDVLSLHAVAKEVSLILAVIGVCRWLIQNSFCSQSTRWGALSGKTYEVSKALALCGRFGPS